MLDFWAQAWIDLGISTEDWLEMTPRHVFALRKRHIQKMQREELLVGIMASTSANFSFCRPERPISPESFMLHPFPHQPEKPVTGEDIMKAFAHIPKAGDLLARPVVSGKAFA